MNIIAKAFRKLYYLTLGKSPVLDRFFRYRGNPQDYWVKRGGEAYFEEQEAVQDSREERDAEYESQAEDCQNREHAEVLVVDKRADVPGDVVIEAEHQENEGAGEPGQNHRRDCDHPGNEVLRKSNAGITQILSTKY